MEAGAAIWMLIGASALAALGYGFVFLNAPPSPARAAVKTAFMGALAVVLWAMDAPPLLIAAAVASAAGDAFLAFDKKWVLPLGILSFLIAQLCYLALFRQLMSMDEPLWARYAAMAVIAATAIGFLVWLWPKLGPLMPAIVFYSLAIAFMAMQAMWLPWAAWPAMLGAISFMVSDGLISAELFMLAPDAPQRRITAPVVWWTYVAAQALIIYGVLQVL